MTNVAHRPIVVNPLVNPLVDATIDATDTGFAFGYEDATEGNDQAGSAYFPPGSPAWRAYNEGYRQGCIHAAVLTGVSRAYVDFGSQDDYVPFQMPKEAYSGVMFDYQRDDYVGA